MSLKIGSALTPHQGGPQGGPIRRADGGGRRSDDEGLWRTADGEKCLLLFSNTLKFNDAKLIVVRYIFSATQTPFQLNFLTDQWTTSTQTGVAGFKLTYFEVNC